MRIAEKVKGEIEIARALLVTKDFRILVLTRSNRFDRAAPSDLPGGKIEKNETAKKAVAREIMEETGLVVSEKKLIDFGRFTYATKNQRVGETLFCLLLKRVIENCEITLDAREHQSFKFCDLELLREERLHPQLLFEIMKRKKKIYRLRETRSI